MSTQVQAPVSKKRKRGRETALDMVRSLGLVVLIIVPIWYLAQPPDSDESRIRVVDPSGAIAAFAADVPRAPVPGSLPEGWRATSSSYEGGDGRLRVGYVTPAEQYAEYSAAGDAGEDFVRDAVGEDAEQLETVTVDGRAWELYREQDGSLSYVGSYGGATVVVGTLRATASPEELGVLLRSLTTG